MSDYWYDEDYEYEPEPELDLPDESAELKIKLSINAGQIEMAIQKQVNDILEDRIKKMIREKISDAMNDLLKKDYWSKSNIKEILYRAVNSRLDAAYPEVTENKVNEFVEAIKGLKYSELRNDKNFESIAKRADRKVQEYIDGELSESVKQSKEYIEQFAKNYFANNLFRAMGMMDKMLPQTENILDEK